MRSVRRLVFSSEKSASTRQTSSLLPSQELGTLSASPAISSRPDICSLMHTRRISILGGTANSSRHSAQQEWHAPAFMADALPEDREKWLDNLLASDLNRSDVDAEAYLVAVEGWAKSRHKAAARRAEDLLIRLERHFDESGKDDRLRPRVEHYNAVIGAWAGSQEDVSIVRAERWLNKLRAEDDATLCPNTESYNQFLDACSKGHGKRNDVLRNNAMKAEEVLKEMMTLQEERGQREECTVGPNTESFNYVIRAWTRCRQDMTIAEKVMDVLRLMELYQRTGDAGMVKANTISYCMAIDAHSTAAGLKSQRALRALRKKHGTQKRGNSDDNNITLTDTPADCAGAEDLEKAASILEYMHNLADAGDINVFPTTDAYNTYIGAYARTANELNPKAPLAAEGILRKMMAFRDQALLHIQPDQRSYIQVMRAWGKARRSNSGERAEWWLRNMWTEYEETGNEKVRPNLGAYLAVMEAYFLQSNATKLEGLLLELLEHEKTNSTEKDNTLVANTSAFTFVIRGWIRHEESLSVEDMGYGCEKALHWLDLLLDREDQKIPHAATSPELYAGIVKAAKDAAMGVKTTRVSKRVLKTALEAFSEFRSSRHAVEQNAYAWIMQIGLKALSSPADDAGRQKLIRHLSKACCEDGYVSKNFVNALSNGPIWAEGWTAEESERMTKEVFGDWPMPKSWSRNIRRSGDIPKPIDTRRSRFRVEDWHRVKELKRLKAQQQVPGEEQQITGSRSRSTGSRSTGGKEAKSSAAVAGQRTASNSSTCTGRKEKVRS